MADPTRELMTAAADEVEAALQDACAAICEAMAEYQQKNGVTDAEVREALVRADFDSSHNHFREVGFASAWDDFERTEEAP